VQGWILVCLGGALGAGARHALHGWVTFSTGAHFPWGTLTVNVLGSLLIGVLLGSPWGGVGSPPGPRLFLASGLLGGFTTYSSFSWETFALLRGGQVRAASVSVLLNTLGSVVACAAGFLLARRLFPAGDGG
jgi:CrcB protein